MNRFLSPFLMALICCLYVPEGFARSETADSLSVVHPEYAAPSDGADIMPQGGREFSGTGYRPGYEGYRTLGSRYPLSVNPQAVMMPGFAFVPGQADICSWGSGGVYADGASANLPGMMGIETGALTFRQHIGAFTLSLFGSATKYGYFRGLSTTYGFGGSLSYRVSDNVGITLFGSYSSPAGISQPSMLGYVGVPQFGGYVDWRFHEHWGVKVGAQSYRSVVYGGRWETQPIVMPYYRTGSGAEIGIDLGGILYEIIRSASGNRWGGYGNPTVGKPDFGPPPVPPHQ